MPSLPTRPTKDPDKLSASWLCKLLDCVAYAMRNPQGDGKTILNESSGTLRAIRQSGGGIASESQGGDAKQVVLAKIAGKLGTLYSVTLWADGYDKPTTGTGYVKVLMLNYSDTLPNGTEVLVSLGSILATGGGDVY